MQSKSQKFDEQTIKAILKRCWSRESSSLWTEQNSACGQCGVTALVIQDQFGGEILKTPMEERWHFYNQIDGERYDLTIEQFTVLPNYMDLPSNREEAFADTNQNQYGYLLSKFHQMLK
ncbi:MAG: hypothetical protein HC899_18630 [Leptolyngbyaceae cyanobacterium SM1_4_3]|nr:hypothetical protein [Leptolyngbyaceae cyanobacterium SM1_4_3]NJN89007.1 hypothetical protein [Leptolyngbyaceae cyanobacterium SL_5_14]